MNIYDDTGLELVRSMGLWISLWRAALLWNPDQRWAKNSPEGQWNYETWL